MIAPDTEHEAPEAAPRNPTPAPHTGEGPGSGRVCPPAIPTGRGIGPRLRVRLVSAVHGFTSVLAMPRRGTGYAGERGATC